MEIHAVIMAGGSGTRLWPISRQNKPKQYTDLGQGKSMLLQTIERLYPIVPPDRCHIITNCGQRDVLTDALHTLISPPDILYEPSGRNTAACIAYSALLLKKRAGNGIVCFIPSDSYISGPENYRTTLETAFRAAQAAEKIFIVGITPAYPATGYGYIKPDTGCNFIPGTDSSGTGSDIFKVACFEEKPDMERAKMLYSTGEYLWNSGMVIGQTDTILRNVREFLPDLYNRLSNAIDQEDLPDCSDCAGQPGFTDHTGCADSAGHAGCTEVSVVLQKAYDEIESISFDSGVLEKSSDVYVVRGTFGWDDIGSVDALDRIHGRDSEGNTIVGTHLGMDTKDSVIYSKDRFTATLGLENMIVVSTGDVFLVCPRNRVQDIKRLVTLLKQNGYECYL